MLNGTSIWTIVERLLERVEELKQQEGDVFNLLCQDFNLDPAIARQKYGATDIDNLVVLLAKIEEAKNEPERH